MHRHDALDFPQTRHQPVCRFCAAQLKQQTYDPFWGRVRTGRDTKIASRHFVITSPPMSLVTLEAGLASILPVALDLQSADGKVLLGADGKNFPQNASSIPVRNAKRHSRPARLRKTAFKGGKDGNHDEVTSGCGDSEDRQSCSAGHAYGGGYPNGRRRCETFYNVFANENDASANKSDA